MNVVRLAGEELHAHLAELPAAVREDVRVLPQDLSAAGGRRQVRTASRGLTGAATT